MFCSTLSAIVYFNRIFPGDHSEEVTPVPIPNTEVKGLSGNGSVAIGHVRVARCRDYFLARGPDHYDPGLLCFKGLDYGCCGG